MSGNRPLRIDFNPRVADRYGRTTTVGHARCDKAAKRRIYTTSLNAGMKDIKFREEPSREEINRLMVKFLGSPNLHQAPVPQQGNTIAQPHRFLGVMRHDQ